MAGVVRYGGVVAAGDPLAGSLQPHERLGHAEREQSHEDAQQDEERAHKQEKRQVAQDGADGQGGQRRFQQKDAVVVHNGIVILHGASVRRKRDFRGLGAYVVRGDVRVFQHGRRAVGGQIPEEQIAVEAVETVPLRGKAEASLEKFLKLGDVAAHQNVADDV